MMKPPPTHIERFTLPATARGRELADLLVSAALACGRTAVLTQEIMEAEDKQFPVLVVEFGKRPMEGEIASRMKQNMEAEWGTRIKKNVNI